MNEINVTAEIYLLSDIPEDIIKNLTDDYENLSRQLNLDNYLDTPCTEGFFENLHKYPVLDTLSPKIIHNLKDFCDNVIVPNIHLLDIENRYIVNDDNLSYLLKLRRLMSEQLEYINLEWQKPSQRLYPDKSDCKIWIIISKLNNMLYGGTFVFWNFAFPNIVMMQGICKFLSASILHLLYPEYDSKLPRLNSLVQPLVEKLTKDIGASIIYVAPIGNQGHILEKHYGYKKTDNIIYPSNVIRGSDVISSSPKSFSLYVKLL